MKQVFLFLIATFFFQPLGAQGLTASKMTYLVTSREIKQLVTQGVMSPKTVATNYLVTHHEIYQKTQEGYFVKKASVTITDDNLCITVTEAKAWLTLDESQLPTNGRMPLWQELVPTIQCTGVDKKVINWVCQTGTKTYTRSVYNSSTGKYTCYYVYKWSDGTQSAEYSEQSPYGNGAGPCVE